MSDLYFCPERWEPDPNVSTNEAKQLRVHVGSGKTADAWQLGSYGGGWTAITSQIPIEAGWLEPGGEYRLCFWLNGGESAKHDEVCTLEIYGDDWENRLRFPLNRDRTRPIMMNNNWLLYGVPFTAPETAEALNFRFVAANAVCTVAGIPDMDMAACEALTPDERIPDEPQRHNIFYPEGYPPEQKRVVLKARGREISVSAAAVKIAAGAAAAVVGMLLLHGIRKKEKR